MAAGLSGPGRFRYGGVRDFILAVQFADGTGQLLRGGAKVVKNAAGFDIPKFFTGSLGRFGVLVEVTFKADEKNPPVCQIMSADVIRLVPLPAGEREPKKLRQEVVRIRP